MTTNVPFPTLSPTGYVVPDDSAILTGVIADMQAAFGGDLNLSLSNTSSLSTPQGQLASSLAAMISDCFSQFLSYTSQQDPQYAQGRMQDAIGYIYFLSRYPATSTLITCTCSGLAGTVIPVGALIMDASGSIYQCTAAVTIPSAGNIVTTFENQVTGPIAVTSPMSIYQVITGWDGVGVAISTILGQDVETQQAFETRRQDSVSLNALGFNQSIKAAVLASGTTLVPPQPPVAAYVVDNPTEAIAMTGQAATFIGSISGSVLTVGAIVSGLLAVNQLVFGTGITPGVTIASLGTGTGGTGTYNLSASVGTILNETMTSGGILLPPNSLFVATAGGNDVQIAQAIWSKKSPGCSYAPSTMFTASVSGTSLYISAMTSGIVTVGQQVSGGGIVAGTIISGLGSGSGGIGSYVLNIDNGSVGSESMTSATVVTVSDTTYSTPQPTYAVGFTKVVNTPLNIAVTLASVSNPPSNALALLQDSVTGLAMALNGTDGGAAAAGIGVTIYGSRFYPTILSILPGVSIISVLIGTGSPINNSQSFGINQYPTIGTITLALQ